MSEDGREQAFYLLIVGMAKARLLVEGGAQTEEARSRSPFGMMLAKR